MFLVGIGGLGAPELMIILAIVIVLFGAGKLATLGRDFGQGIREFRKASKDPEEDARKRAEEARQQAEAERRYTSTNGTNGVADVRPVDAPQAPSSTTNRPPDFVR